MRFIFLGIAIVCAFYSCSSTPNNELDSRQVVEKNTFTLSGLEVLRQSNFEILKGKKVGLITNPTGVDKLLRSTVDILHQSTEVNLVALYGPEHGVRGNFSAGSKVQSTKDPKTGLPVFSLYGKNKKPSKEMLSGIDVLVFDIQDVGVRSYTYISTMGLAMEAAAENGIEFVVLDRPNPLGGEHIEGPIVKEGFFSFVSQYPIPYRHGLTVGELARFLNGEKLLKDGVQCKLTVVPMKNWLRSMPFEKTGLPWVPTSPHIPRKNSAYFYAASGILGELDANMIGVGYTLPFEVFATPWLDAEKLAERMNGFGLKGVLFRPIHFKPYYMKKKGVEHSGVQVHITDFGTVNLTEIQFRFAEVAHALSPDRSVFKQNPSRFEMFDLVCGSDAIRKAFMKRYKFEDIRKVWEGENGTYRKVVEKYHLY